MNNIIKIGINNLILWLSIIGLSFCNNLNAQDAKISISTNLILVCIGDSSRVNCENVKSDSIPIRLGFFFDVNPITDKKLLFGANTFYYYSGRNNPSASSLEDKFNLYGRFLIINKQDTIALYSDQKPVPIYRREFSCSGWIINMFSPGNGDVLNNFLCNIPSDKAAYTKYISDFIYESEFVYIPIVEEYEQFLEEKYPTEKKEMAYPDSKIPISLLPSLEIIYEYCGDE